LERSVYKINKVGSINNLKLSKETFNNPAEDQVSIQVKAIGLNFADVFSLQGLYQAAPRNNLVPGLEFSGVVINKGKNVLDFNPGDKVIGITKFGAYATHINLNKNYLLKLPDNWTFEEGASFIVQALTAYYAIKELGNVKNNQIVLIHSIAGGVGIYLNRIAKKFNCTTIGTVGDQNKIGHIKDESIDYILVRDNDFLSNLKKILENKKLDLLMESLTGKYFKPTYEMLAPQGRAVVYGASNFATQTSHPNYLQLAYRYFTRPKVDILKLIEQNKSVMGFNLIWLYENADTLKILLDELIALNLKKPYVSEVYDFNQMTEAIKHFQSGKTFGKIVVKIE